VRDRHDPGVPGDLGVDAACLGVNSPWLVVTTGGWRIPRRPPPAAQGGVVVDDVHIGQCVVGGQDMSRFGNVSIHRRDPRGIQELERHRAGGVTDREEPHVVTQCLQAPGEVVDDDLVPPYRVAGRAATAGQSGRYA